MRECKATSRRIDKVSDDSLYKNRHEKNMRKLNLQHGLFANFNGKYLVGAFGCSKEKNCFSFFFRGKTIFWEKYFHFQRIC